MSMRLSINVTNVPIKGCSQMYLFYRKKNTSLLTESAQTIA
jgi:hypothetical protein